jgi:two-component system NtrC family sensor kinase
VFIRRLKTKIAVNIALLLLVAMVLIDLVITLTAQRDLIRAEVSKANAVISRLEDYVLSGSLWENVGFQAEFKARIIDLFNQTGVSCAVILRTTGGQVYFAERQCTSQNELLNLTRQAIAAGKRTIHFEGTAWGIFWEQHRNLVISEPLFGNDATVAGIGIALPLDGIYTALRHSQKIFLIYILINTAILGFVGFYRLSKLYFQPLARLARRAEDYREDDEFIFTVRKEDNELNKLSKSLNLMLKRISGDKEKLRSTVMSLEKANLELRQAQKEIVRAEKLASVGRLSAGIAHEIGNPIGIVMGYLGLLKQKDITADERNEYVLRTEKELERINTIIRQLLDISRPSHTGLSRVSVHDLIDDIAEVLNVQPLMANIDLRQSLSAEKDVVLADANQLRQVFLNLIINAADAIAAMGNGENGQLRIATEVATDTASLSDSIPRLKIRFIDSGPGIPEDRLGNIFDPFYTTKEPGKGTGLGLAVSFMIIERFGGHMTATSEVGKGTTMVVYLPLADKQAANPG